jgi:alpha-tubulin suppressor-like RCC1 family protein
LWSSSARADGGAGSTLAWGYNQFGQLGDSSTMRSPVPVAVSAGATPPGTTMTRLAAGFDHSVALSSTGHVYAWGDNAEGQLGNDSTADADVPVAVSAGAIPAGTRFTQIAAGAEHSLALSSTGQMYAWGDNSDGELGNDSTAGADVPVAVSAGAIPAGTRITQIAAGDGYSLALSSTGQVYAWGYNLYGQLGNNSTANSEVPVAVSAGAIPPATTLTQVAAGDSHSFALSSTGQLYAWGYNGYGQLGNGTTTNAQVPVAVAAGGAPPGTTFTQVAAGAQHTVALASSGQVYAWGDNDVGQLGNHSMTSSPVPVAVSAGAIPPATTITQIAAGDSHSLVLSSTGQLYAWGNNGYGVLGDNVTASSSVPVAVSLPAGTTIDTLARGGDADHALAIIGDLSLTANSLRAGTVDRSYTAAVQGGGGVAPYRFSATGLPPGLTLNSASGEVSGTPTVAGSYTVAATLTDADGLASAHGITLTIAPAPTPTPTPTPCPAGQTGTPPNCHTRPTVTHLAQSHRTWREPSSRPRTAPVGTTFSFSLNQAATVGLAFTQPVSGRELKHKCVAPTRTNRRGAVCKLTAIRGRLSLVAHAGQDKLHFQGQTANHHKLKPGRYTLDITATNSAHQNSDKEALTFTIVK